MRPIHLRPASDVQRDRCRYPLSVRRTRRSEGTGVGVYPATPAGGWKWRGKTSHVTYCPIAIPTSHP